MLDGNLRRLGHTDGVAAENLHGGGVLAGELLKQGEGLFVVIAQGLGGDQLRDRVARPQLGADLAKGHIRDACHGGQSQPGVDLYCSNAHTVPSFCHKINSYHITERKKSPQGIGAGLFPYDCVDRRHWLMPFGAVHNPCLCKMGSPETGLPNKLEVTFFF